MTAWSICVHIFIHSYSLLWRWNLYKRNETHSLKNASFLFHFHQTGICIQTTGIRLQIFWVILWRVTQTHRRHCDSPNWTVTLQHRYISVVTLTAGQLHRRCCQKRNRTAVKSYILKWKISVFCYNMTDKFDRSGGIDDRHVHHKSVHWSTRVLFLFTSSGLIEMQILCSKRMNSSHFSLLGGGLCLLMFRTWIKMAYWVGNCFFIDSIFHSLHLLILTESRFWFLCGETKICWSHLLSSIRFMKLVSSSVVLLLWLGTEQMLQS